MKIKLPILLFIFLIQKLGWCNPVANFTLSNTQGCVPLTIKFTNTSTGSPTRFEWTFGNGNRSTLQHPSAIYYASGKFSVTLTVWDANGNKSSKTFNPVKVFINPKASFSADTVGCTGKILNFNDLSTNGDTAITQWSWDYGDGEIGGAQNPSHSYTYAGRYAIGLTVTDGYGCKSSATKTNYIRIKPSPVLDFSVDKPYSCSAPHKVFVLNKSKGATNFNWSCSNGATSSAKDFHITLNNFGNYSITLTATQNGCTSTLTRNAAINIEKLTPNFNISNTTICEGASVNFVNTSRPDNNTFSYLWEFGDGQTSTEKNPSHKYDIAEKHTVKLTISGGGCTESITKELIVNPNPEVYITILDSISCKSPFNVEFILNCNDYTTCDWNFGEDSFTYFTFYKNEKIKHVYRKPGIYTSNYIVKNKFGCKTENIAAERVFVNSSSVKIKPRDIKACIPLNQNFSFDLNSPDEADSVFWYFADKKENVFKNDTNSSNDSSNSDNTDTTDNSEFEDGETGETSDDIEDESNLDETEGIKLDTIIGKTATKKYLNAGNWKVYLTVKTKKGCILKDSTTVSVGNVYYPEFKLFKREICNGQKIIFRNLTPDSIKKIENIQFDLVPNDKGAIDEIKNIKDSILTINAKRIGRIDFLLRLTHLGCETYSKNTDYVIIRGPAITFTHKWLDCRKTKFKLYKSYRDGNRDSLYYNGKLILHHDSFIYHSKDYNYLGFLYKAWNDEFGCYGFKALKAELTFPLESELKGTQNQTCAPAALSLNYNGYLKNTKWHFPDGTSSTKLNESYTANQPGKIKILFTGNFTKDICDDTITIDSSYLYFNIDGVQNKSNVKANGKCMPIALSLYDSTAGTDNNEHKWIINGEEIFTTQLLTNYTVNSIPAGNDSAINISHIITSNNGCISTKNYALPFAGPKLSYSLFRYFSCDTTAHYYDTKILDSITTRFPLKYEWKFDDGNTFNTANIRAFLGKVGMNYFTLSVKDAYNCETKYIDSVEVSPNMLQPLFYSNPLGSSCPPLRCKFFDQSKTFSSQIVSWEWDFGDGTSSRLQFPEKLYLVPGKFDVTLKVTSKSGCTAFLKKPNYIVVNGPRGDFNFDRGNACLPHTVEFRGKAIDSATMEWDFGDGVLQQGNNIKHIYNRRGKYIPAMILSDKLGCKYILPPIDTIEIFDYPKANFKTEGLCFNDIIKVKNNTISNHEDTTVKTTWYYNQRNVNPLQDRFYKPEKRGWNELKIIVENKGTCKDTAITQLRIFAPIANYKPFSPLVCLGFPLQFINQSSSDTFIKSFDWQLGDNNTSTLKNPSHTYLKAGQYNVRLIATDELNCADTSYKIAIANVGDTATPPLVPIRKASVLNNRTVELVYSKFPTFDFNKYFIYKNVNGKYLKTAEINNVNDTVFLDRYCNTLNQSYCYKIATQNLCLKTSNEMLTPQHCTIETKALGKFEENTITWSPYVGFDSIQHYEIWRQDFNNPTNFEYISKVQGNLNTYTDIHINCYTRQNYKIIAQQYLGFNEKSYSDTASAKPSTINTTTPNYAWQATVEDNDYAHIEWLNNAWSRNGMKAYLLTKQNSNGTTIFKDKYFNLLDTIFNDYNTKVQDNSYIYTIKGIDMCNDTTPISNVAQTILLKAYFDENSQKPALRWNHYQKWSQNIAYYDIEQKQLDGSFINIGKVAASDSSFIDYNAQSNCNPQYIYRVRAISNTNMLLNRATFSLSNEAKVLPTSTLFMPNVFSPNRNNINENFGPNGQYIHRYHLEIYNRWGEKLFETTNCMEHWNGKFKNEECPQEVYLYHLEAMGADNKTYNLKGTFHLLR